MAWRETILASALPESLAPELDGAWIERGRITMRERGLAGALFCIRLLEQQSHGSASDRLAFFYGVFLESDLGPWLQRRRLPQASIAVVGTGALARAWAAALAATGSRVDVIADADAEGALIAGLDAVLTAVVPRLAR